MMRDVHIQLSEETHKQVDKAAKAHGYRNVESYLAEYLLQRFRDGSKAESDVPFAAVVKTEVAAVKKEARSVFTSSLDAIKTEMKKIRTDADTKP